MSRIFTIGLAAVFGFLWPAVAYGAGGETEMPESAKALSTWDSTYDLFAGGVTMGQVTVNARIQGQNYKIVSDLLTRGMVNRLWQATIQASSNGVMEAERVVPSLYNSYSVNPRRTQQVTLSYDAEGPTALHAEPAYDLNEHPVTPDQQKATLDPLSAVLYVVSGIGTDDANPCGTSAPIFDGRRRYDIELNLVKRDDIRMENGIYTGPVLVCAVKYRQIAGFGQTILRTRGRVPDIFVWVARVADPANSSHRYFVPLRLLTDTPFGRIVALVSKLKFDGQNFKTAE